MNLNLRENVVAAAVLGLILGWFAHAWFTSEWVLYPGQTAGEPVVFKLNKATGEVWSVTPKAQQKIP